MNKILLVEDDKEIIKYLSDFLRREGFDVKNAVGQTSALNLLSENVFDLVLLDVMLADGNGFTTCSAKSLNTICR